MSYPTAARDYLRVHQVPQDRANCRLRPSLFPNPASLTEHYSTSEGVWP